MNLPFPTLMYLAGTQDFPSSELFFAHVERVCRAGLKWFQYREKALTDSLFLEMADRLRELTRQHGTLLTINDRPDIALLSEADGVHLGQDDLPSVREFRKLFPSDTLHLGISTHNLYEVRRALLLKPDYLGVGPIFPSSTKDTGITPRGIEAIRETGHLTSLPLVAIGGITPDRAGELYQAGSHALAVSGAITASGDPLAVLEAFSRSRSS
ncbi:MAG: thiamine phosphate synthase [Nitrospirae bacterium]|jgi:thiamine-phosphate pyrophosphorylase|nr:thiamine phosphate synthase [Nitrospirota bacterium]